MPLLLLLAVCVMSSESVAQTAGDPVTGHRIVQQWCTSCHSAQPAIQTDAPAPALVTIANDPTKTEEYLRHWLIRPHPPMPDFSLSRNDINDILAFLATLKQQ